MRNNFILLFLLILALSACNSFPNKNSKIPGIFIPRDTGSSKRDTAFMIGRSKYKVEITQIYTGDTTPSRRYNDKKGNPYYRYYRDLHFDISIYKDDSLKFNKKNLYKKDFSENLPKNLQDSGVMRPIVFQYVADNSLFIFYSKISIPGSDISRGVGLVVNQQFQPNFIVTR